MMKYVLLPILYCLFLLSAQAQDLVKGLHESPYTYIFLLSNDEARQLYEEKFESLLPAYTNVLVDSFPTGKSYTRQLAAGNYLFVHAFEEKLVLELERVHNVALELLPDPLKFIAAVYDSSGNLLLDAKVLVDGKTMPFSSATKNYQRAFRRKYKLIEVVHEGVSNFFFLEKYQGSYRQPLPRKIINKIIFFRPVRMLWRPVQDIVNAIRWGEHPEWFNIFDPDHQRDFGGYLTLNQPVYRPGDTVRYKGFVLKKHRPFRKPLTVKLYGKTSKGFKTYTLTTLQAYRNGAYEGSFVLHDSLNLLLDTYATLRFEHKRKELRSQIKLEDYELGGNTFSLRASRNMHVQGAPPSIIMRGMDVNGFSLLGAEVKLIALTSKIDYLPAALQLVVPDTLWQHTIKLEPGGETQLQLPDSLFLEADIDYNLVGILKTARQEFLTQRLQMQYRREALVNYVLDGDSLYISYLKKGLSDTLQTTLDILLYNQPDEIEQEINLPAKLRLDPRWKELTVWAGHYYETLNLEQKSSLVEHAVERNADSLLISISSGRHIPFWYSIYTGKKKKKKVAAGFSAGEPVLWQARASKGKTYFLKLNYLWGGEMKEVREDIPLLK
ncbi:MAG: hypothetical protein KY428_12720, partial [Bacteroidetes bacterium]|nr:hypothetical protein [Bacteroidota bacterium]